jgi:hypothetical protein
MVYFENAFRWSFFHHNLKMHGPSCKFRIYQVPTAEPEAVAGRA